MEKEIKRICKTGHHKALLTELGLPRQLSGKESVYQCRRPGDVSSIPGPGRSPEGGNGNPLQHSSTPLQYSCLKNPIDRGA